MNFFNLKPKSIKAMASSSFMNALDLTSISSAKDKADKNSEKKKEDFEKEYNEGLNLFRQFAQDKNQDTIKKASSKFFSAIKCKRSRIEPYIYLAYIFHIFDKKERAIEYLNRAKSLDPHSELVIKLQAFLYNN
ncbi:MAG: hypothetical protein ACK4IX_05165 [Candidatus Sericytochromatia bacterium]